MLTVFFPLIFFTFKRSFLTDVDNYLEIILSNTKIYTTFALQFRTI